MGNLFVISAAPILKIVLLCLAGAAATWGGFIDPVGRRQLSVLVFNVFSPALLFIKLASTITFGNLIAWVPIMLFTWLGIVLGLCVGSGVNKALDIPAILRPIVLACVSMANTGNVPLVVVSSLAMDATSPFRGLEAVGIAYVALAMFAQSTVFFSLGFTLMKKPDAAAAMAPAAAEPATAASAAAAHATATTSDAASERAPVVDGRSDSIHGADAARDVRPSGAPAVALEIGEQESSKRPHEMVPSPAVQVPSVLELIKGVKLKDVFTPPNRASFAALIIGCTPFLRTLFFSADPTNQAPLEVLTSAISILADACVPCMMVVLGSILAGGPGGANVPRNTILGVILGKLIIVPLLGMAVVVLFLKIGWFSPPDPFYTLVILLNLGMPTALNMQTLSVLNAHCELEVSALLFWQYLCAIFTLPVLILLSLLITSAK